MSSLLFNERPLIVQPKLAYILGGTDEALVLQQVHYWTQKNMNIEDGHSWVYNSTKGWQKQFYWFSESKVKRIFRKLEKLGVLITGNYNKTKFDKTKWYRIDYSTLDDLERRLVQNDPTKESNCTNGEDQVEPTNTIDYTETTTDINNTSETLCVSDNKKTRTIKKKYKPDDQAYKCAVKLQNEILKNKPDFKRADLQKWANTFRLMHERDKRSWKDIGYVILYATADDFWKNNILSADKLRKQFDLLQLQMQSKNHNSKRRRQRETLPEWAKKDNSVASKASKLKNENIDAEINELLAQLEANKGGG